jgi:sulfite exporter TauE/SafE
VALRGPRQRSRRLRALGAAVSGLLARARSLPPPLRAAALGASSGLLPCGWLYAFVVVAAGSGAASTGAGVMFAFWLGSLPALLGLALGTRWLSRRLSRVVPRLGAALLVVVGLGTLALRLPAASETSGSSPPACHGQH